MRRSCARRVASAAARFAPVIWRWRSMRSSASSRWNAKNRFTGWTDVRLTQQGERESWAAGRLLHSHGLRVAAAFTSQLTRAQTTLRLALDAAGQADGSVPLDCSWRLNERHYGALTGLNKAECMEKLGAEWTMAIRRGSAGPPPIDARTARVLVFDRPELGARGLKAL